MSVSEKSWLSLIKASSVNAMYRNDVNKIYIRAGILQRYIYRFDRPAFLNYGAIGYVIGHEITHGFDSQGRKYNEIGNYKNWWKPAIEEKYLQKAQCFIDQYNNATVPKIDANVNFTRVLSKWKANIGGKLSRQWWIPNSLPCIWVKRNNINEPALPGLNYTPQQMFWISAASNYCGKARPDSLRESIHYNYHSPMEARVETGLSNFGSKMNPGRKCKLW